MNDVPQQGGSWGKIVDKIIDKIASRDAFLDIAVMMLGLGSMRFGAALDSEPWIRMGTFAVGVIVTLAGVYCYVSRRRRSD